LHLVGLLFNVNYNARNHELKKMEVESVYLLNYRSNFNQFLYYVFTENCTFGLHMTTRTLRKPRVQLRHFITQQMHKYIIRRYN